MNTSTTILCMALAIAMLSHASNVVMAQADSTGKLKDVVVKARKPLIKQEADRISYDLQADPDSKGTNVLEMMRKVPYLSLDGDDNILLKGNAAYRILINGKPSGMMERNAKEVLRSMPASTILRIEVITTPPSRYDSEGLGGIINIITTKKIANGYNGTVNAFSKWPTNGPGMGASFAWKEEKFGLSAFGGWNASHEPFVQNTLNRQTTGDPASILRQSALRAADGRNAYLGTELSFEVDSLQLLSVQLNTNKSFTEATSNQTSILRDETSVLQQYNLIGNNNGNGGSLDAAVNYQLTSRADKNRLLTFSYRYFNYTNNSNNNLDVSNTIHYDVPDYKQANEERTDEQTFQVDYVRPIKKQMLQMETGLKGIWRDSKTDFEYLSYTAGSNHFQKNKDRSNQFTNRQYIFGVYNTWQLTTNKWGLKAGLRLEQTIVKAEFISTASTAKQNYLNLIPALNINRKIGNSNSLNFGWTLRFKRPGINKLNPYVDRSNPNMETSGNPNLKAVSYHDFSLNYSRNRRLTLNMALGYAFANNFDFRVTNFDKVNNITRVTVENMGKASRLAIDYTANYPITQKWTCSINGALQRIRIGGMADGAWTEKRWLMHNETFSSAYRLNKGWRANTTLAVTGPGPSSLQTIAGSVIRYSFAVNKELIKDKLSVSTTLHNLFAKFRDNRKETNTLNFIETANTAEYFRSFNITVNYSFGKLKETIRRNKRGIKNDDGGSGGN